MLQVRSVRGTMGQKISAAFSAVLRFGVLRNKAWTRVAVFEQRTELH